MAEWKAEKIDERLAAQSPDGIYYSFEYFPPRTDTGVTNLVKRIEHMKVEQPEFVDFTWGAGGTTSDLTTDLSIRTQKEHQLNVNMHLTCTNMPREKLDIALKACQEAGIVNICALRGDPPKGVENWTAIDTGFSCALDLVKHIRAETGDTFSLSVAGYPEGHPDRIGDDGKCSADLYEKELDYLKEKIDAGGNLIITQLFYDVDIFLKFVADCRAKGITVPILPGILPIQTAGGFNRMVTLCKTYAPQEVKDKVEELKDDEVALKKYGVQQATEMCNKILAAGIRHLHFYCLNTHEQTYQILENLGQRKGTVSSEIKPSPAAAAAAPPAAAPAPAP